MDIEKLQVVIEAKTDDFQRKLASVTNQTKQFSDKIDKTFVNFSGAGNKATKKMTDDYIKNLDRIIQITEIKLNVLSDKMLSIMNGWSGGNLDKLGFESDTFDSYLRTLKKYKEGIENGEIDFDEQPIKDVAHSIEEATLQITTMKGAIDASAEWKNNLTHLNAYYMAVKNLTGELTLGEGTKTSLERLFGIEFNKDKVDEYTQKIKELVSELQSLTGLPKSQLIKQIEETRGPRNKYAASAVREFGSISSTPQTDKSDNKSSSFSVATLGKALIGVRSIYMLIRKIVSQNEKLTNAINTLFTTLGNVLEPILNVIAALIEWVSQLLGKVFNVSTKSKDANEQIARTLASFDELNTLSNTKIEESTGTNSLSEATENLKEAIEEIPLVKAVNQANQDYVDRQMSLVEQQVANKIANKEKRQERKELVLELETTNAELNLQAMEYAAQWFKDAWDKTCEWFKKLGEDIAKIWDGVCTAIGKFWDAHMAKFFTKEYWTTKFDNIKSAISNSFKNICNVIIDKVQTAVNNIVNNFNNSGFIRGINKILGTSIALTALNIPRLANGGVLTSPTLAMVGEYAGANRNPEIVSPRNEMLGVFTEANGELANVIIQVSKQIINSIESKDTSLSIDGTTIAKSVGVANNKYKQMTGLSLI